MAMATPEMQQTGMRLAPSTLLTLAIGSLAILTTAIAPSAHADDRLHHTVDLALEPATGHLEATDRVEVSGYERLAIKLAAGLSIDQIMIDDEAFTTESEDGVTWIPLPSDGEHQVEIAYNGKLEQDDGRRGLSPMVSADGAFLPYGIGWLANGGAEDDRVTYVLNLDVPVPYKAVATGSLIDEEEVDGRYRASFESTMPTEPPSVFAGELQIDERNHGELRLRTYFPADRQDMASTYLDQAAGYIDLFEEQIGAYPYDGFSMVSAPLPVGLGFPGLTYISSQILHMPFMLTRSLAHEIAHNWWANGVFVDTSEGNWAEGLTTYMADYALAETAGEAPCMGDAPRLAS